MSHVSTLTRDEILAHGFPEGFLDRQREAAQVARVRAMGSFLAALVRGFVPRRASPAGSGLAST